MGFRGANPYADSGFNTGGNSVVSNATGIAQGANQGTSWHPTILYLFGLLVVEWVLLFVLQKYI